MDDVASRKRARVDSNPVKRETIDSDIRLVVYQNHPTLYHEDGNTIFSSASTLFCVHRSVVSKNSPVLRALLEEPERKTLRGMRHFEMEETAEDLEALLNVIYEGS